VRLLGEGARQVSALVYAVDRRHPQYAGKLDIEAQLALIGQGNGISGPCVDYVLSAARHLRELGISDRLLDTLADRLAPAAA
jgi:glutathione-specific gamma-glutamylcyclotransferase